MPQGALKELTKGFRAAGIGQAGPLSAQETSRRTEQAIRDTLSAVQNLADTRDISTKQAAVILRNTASQLSAGSKRLRELAKSTGGAPTTLKRLTSLLTLGGGAARGRPVSGDVASFLAKRELTRPSTSIRVFSSESALRRRLLNIRR